MAIWLIVSNLNLVQSGGLAGAFASMPFVGTAPIVESGSNSNGNWIKFADGTMFQWKKIIFTSVANQRTYQIESNRPLAFVGAYFDQYSSGENHGAPQYGLMTFCPNSGTSGSNINLWVYLVADPPAASGVYMVASIFSIGKWK